MKTLTLQDYLDIAARRRWWLIAPVVLALIVAAALAVILPKSYQSSTLILVEPQKVPSEYVRAPVSGSVEDRLSTIRQQILSRTLLQRVINEFNLYDDAIGKVPMESIIESMRKRITIETTKGKSVDAFTISYMGSDPTVTMNVTNRLGSLFTEENLKAREQLVEGTTAFLGDELQRLKQKLELREQSISQFKRQHMGALPGQLDANLRTLDRLQLQLESFNTALREAENRKLMIGQAAQDSGAGAAAGGLMIDPRLSQLQMLRSRLTTLLAEYTSSYPDIEITRQEIARIETELRAVEEPAAADTAAAARPSSSTARLLSPDQDIARLQAGRQNVIEQIKTLEQRVEETPQREQELTSLTRDYDITRRGYDLLLGKESDAKISENLEKRQKGEQFRILDPAFLPEKPVKPNIAVLLFLGLALGIGIGGGLTFLIEGMDTSIKKAEELEEAFGFPVLSVIPRTDSLRKVAAFNGAVAQLTAKGGVHE